MGQLRLQEGVAWHVGQAHPWACCQGGTAAPGSAPAFVPVLSGSPFAPPVAAPAACCRWPACAGTHCTVLPPPRCWLTRATGGGRRQTTGAGRGARSVWGSRPQGRRWWSCCWGACAMTQPCKLLAGAATAVHANCLCRLVPPLSPQNTPTCLTPCCPLQLSQTPALGHRPAPLRRLPLLLLRRRLHPEPAAVRGEGLGAA